MKRSKSKWYLDGYENGIGSALDTDWQPGEMKQSMWMAFLLVMLLGINKRK
jgi:hypothetical protein